MIGIVVTGHGNFASGVTSALKLICGMPESLEIVDFPQEDGIDQLRAKLNTAFNNLSECPSILVFSDLAGGSPFKTAVEESMHYDKPIVVLAGTNLGSLIETTMSRAFVEDIEQLAASAISTGKDQVLRYENKVHEEVESDDGI